MQEKERVEYIYQLLKQHYPNAKMILNYSNNFELLVAVVLSAQCTDVMVNKVTAKLFPKYRNLHLHNSYSSSEVEKLTMNNSSRFATLTRTITPEIQEIINFAEVDILELEQDIRSTGFYHNKAKNIQAAAKMVLDKFGGMLPQTIAELTTLPGVARKTANVVLGNAYGIYEGMAVDTHVSRLSQRLGLSKNSTPEKIEQDLMKLYSQKQWFLLTYLLIEHGRQICEAKKPKCSGCFLNKICPSAFKFPHFKTN